MPQQWTASPSWKVEKQWFTTLTHILRRKVYRWRKTTKLRDEKSADTKNLFQDTSGSSATGTNFLEAAASPYRDHVGMAAYSPYGLSHAERSRHAITSLHLANHYPTTEAGLAAEKVREGDGSRDTKPLLWSQYDHKYPSPGAAGALCSPSSQPPEPCPPHQSWPTAYSQPHPSHYPGLEVTHTCQYLQACPLTFGRSKSWSLSNSW